MSESSEQGFQALYIYIYRIQTPDQPPMAAVIKKKQNTKHTKIQNTQKNTNTKYNT